MAKGKKSSKSASRTGSRSEANPLLPHLPRSVDTTVPAKKPNLLGVSALLFTVWFVYLLIVALGG